MKLALLRILFAALLVALLFGCAGRLDLPFFWAWLALVVAAVVVISRHMDPDLKKERLRPGQGGTDRYLRIIVMPFWIAHFVVAGLDVGRFHWSAHMPLALQVVGLIVLAGTYALAGWAVLVNRFYSPVVRIQAERGHECVTSGPYRWVRHPGYTAALIGLPCGGPTLGSWWSIVPVLPVVVLALRRTIIEDRFLLQNLEGYSDYAHRVRYRLIPGVW